MVLDPAVVAFTDLWASWLPRLAADPVDPLLGVELEAAAARLAAIPSAFDDDLVWALLLGHVRSLGVFMVDGNAVGAWGAFLLIQDLLKGATTIAVQAALDGR